MSQAPVKSIDLEYDEDAPILAANFTRIAATPDDFLIEIGVHTGNDKVRVQGSFLFNPQALKRFHDLLSLQLEQYQKQYGPIVTDARKKMQAEAKQDDDP